MKLQGRHAGTVAGALVVAVAMVSPAGAAEFCVAPATGCAGGQKATLQQALDAAVAANGPDTVRLPTGVVNGPGTYSTANPDNTVDLIGAGRDQTVITSTADGPILNVDRGGTMSDLTVREHDPPPASPAETDFVGTVERVDFIAVDSSLSPHIFGTARHIRGSGPTYLFISGTLEDADLSGMALLTGYGDAIVRRVRVVAPSPVVYGQNRSLRISSSLFRATSPDGTVVGISNQAVANAHGNVLIANTTVIGGGGAGCVGIVAAGDNGLYSDPDDYAVMNMTVSNSIVRNCKTTLSRDSTGGHRTSNLTVFNSDLDLSPAAVSENGNGTLEAGLGDGNVNSDPLFVGLPGFEQELRFDSPLIDLGLVNPLSTEESTTDLDGNPRVVDGNGDGTARSDLGAFEYQRRAPAVSVTASPTTVEIGQPVTFTGTANDADPGEAVASLAWGFDDGAAASGASAVHAFGTPGTHAATLTATDPAGVAGTGSASVVVLAAPAVTKVTLSATTFRAANKGASSAKKRKVPVGTTVTVALTRPTAARITFKRRVAGRRSGKRCARPTSSNRRGKRCTRSIAVHGSIARPSGAAASFRFTGRLRGRKLAPGRYVMVARAGTTPAKTRAFRIVR
jgi:hypothetical protein